MENTMEKKLPRGRPAGRTSQGREMRERIYRISLKRFASHGYEETTLRKIASNAKVSVGLLYKYFPSKQALVLALYDELSQEFIVHSSEMPKGSWRNRFLFSLRKSLAVLSADREVLSALIPILVGDPKQNLFSEATTLSRQRVERVFVTAVMGAANAPEEEVAFALGRVLYVCHLGVILWWLLDKSKNQKSTHSLIELIDKFLVIASVGLRIGRSKKIICTLEHLCSEALYGKTESAPVRK